MANVSLYDQVYVHLTKVNDEAETSLNIRLLEEAQQFLSPELLSSSKEQERIHLVSYISLLLPKLQQDPTPVVELLKNLIKPYSFSDVLAFDPPVDFVAGLDLSARPYNDLILSLLAKAAASPKDAAHIATMPTVVHGLVKLWLCTPGLSTADKAAEVLGDLLKADREPSEVGIHGVGVDAIRASGGQGLLWRRIFSDKDIYSQFYDMCDLKSQSKVLGKKEKTIAQARLMAFAPQLGVLDWNYLTKSHNPTIERNHGLDSRQGLLDFIAINMVDYKDDVLIHVNLIQFFSHLIATVRKDSEKSGLSVSLKYLQDRGIHDRTLAYWMNPDDPNHDPLDSTFLYGPSATYLAIYAARYTSSFVASPDALHVLKRLSKSLDISAGAWAHGQSPKYDLDVLVSLPRTTLLPQHFLGTGRRSSPLLLIPCANTNADALTALARIFRGLESKNLGLKSNGTESGDIIFPAREVNEPDSGDLKEAAGARALYMAYLHYHESMFADLVTHADTVALPERALAALGLLSAIASAEWSPLPTATTTDSPTPDLSSLPSEVQLRALLPRVLSIPEVFADSGIEALLQSPAREKLFPYLLRRPMTFTNLVGGRGDPESAAYRIAFAKWDLLILTHGKLKELVQRGRGDEMTQGLIVAMGRRLAEGPWGSDAGGGNRIASLEM